VQTKIRGVNESGVEGDLKQQNGMLYTLPYHVIWTAKGYGKQAMATSAVASLIVRPTDTAIATLFNVSGSGVNLVIERAFAHNLVAVANSAFAIWLCVHPAGMALPSNNITVRNSTNGKAAGGSNTYFDNGATVLDDGWFPWLSADGHTVAVTTPGGVAIAEIGGRIIIPPTGGLSLSVVSVTAAVTTTCGFHWFEVPTGELVLS